MENQQELMFKLQMYQQHVEQTQSQLQAVEQGINEMANLRIGLDEIVGKKGQEIKAHLGRGIFISANLTSEELLVDVGDKNFVVKSIPDAKNLIEDQILKLEDAKKELHFNLDKIGEEMQNLISEAQLMEAKMAAEEKKESGKKRK